MANPMALARLILIHGSEEVLAERALSEALELRKDYERTTLNGDEIEFGRFSEAIAPSLFADKRVMVLRDLQDAQVEVAEEISQALENLDGGLHLIMIHKGGVKGKGLVEKIKKAKAEVITCEPMKKVTDKQSFVREEFARHGRKISSAGVSALIDATGSDMRELAAACSQIAFDTIASKENIDEEDIAKYYQGRVEATGFDVADAAVAGDPKGALIALRNALDSGTDPIMIISAIATSVRTIAKVSGAPRNASPYQLASTLKLAPWQIEKARRQMSKWQPGMITFSIKELARADLAVKGAEADPIYALERTVVAIAKKVAGK